MIRIGTIIGSTRPGRRGEAVGRWVHAVASKRDDAEFELLDLIEWNLPLLDEKVPPSMGKYEKPHTKAWAAKIASLDAFILVTPEYNHSTSPALKNALDFLYAEWNNKVAGLVGYGSSGGVRAVEHLRAVLSELQIAHVRNQVQISLFTDFEDFSAFKPHPRREESLNEMIDQLIAWGTALKRLREESRRQVEA